ncbi:hypothetical protein Q5424_12825 [Conexibacter sp. JD483]|uniref:hypothetical protein n=1 Tax=unclassified Conexibacter TaxID=2627773 RepID=UPI00271B5D79|nr:MULTISPECIES: hypothetical protein [unclassified Conexibacter]MDO8187312.1 hypothetical protein [Conexibacter sp. CPCC 205706]MDO8200555.1 hypothetical protein [Conexibacter sp. CPCC 205762]MDR9369976.1 hypothetical protein [Conexibacter sp. JD483]
MGDGRDSPAPRHPCTERRSLVLWSAAGLDAALLPRDVAGTLALPLHSSVREGAIDVTRRAEMGIALAPQAWRNQLPPERRGAAFAALPYAQPEALELEAGALSAGAAADYADAVLDAQLAAGATLATTPAHVFEREGGIGRANDLLLASATIAAWHERQGWRPPPQRPDDPPRELYATIAVRARHLPEAVPELLARYSALPVDGFWLVLLDDDATRTSPRVAEAITTLALGLQAAPAPGGFSGAASAGIGGAGGGFGAAASAGGGFGAAASAGGGFGAAAGAGGRPVVVAGAGAWHAALLASGVAATCAGADGAQPTFPPDAAGSDGVVGIGVPVFHPAILGSAPHGAAGEEAREWLFAAHPCRCGEHLAYEPPRGRRATLRHNLACLAAEARDATRLAPLLDETRLAARVERANATRARLALPPLPPAWSAVAATARDLRTAAAAPGLSAGA